MQIHNTNKETQVNTSPTSSCFPVWILPLLLCTDMYWCKVLHATSDSAEPSCHAMLTRRESGGKLPACLDLRVLDKKVMDKNQSKSIFHLERIQGCCLRKKQYQNTFFLEKSIFYFRMRKFIKGSFSWNYISPCNNGVCFLKQPFYNGYLYPIGEVLMKGFHYFN